MPMHLDRARVRLRLGALDARDRVRGRGDRLVPPRRLDPAGHSDYVTTGDAFARHLVELAGLTADSAVLDVGCGSGRMARPLAGILGPAGSYEGFDDDADAVGWCRRRYRRHPNFRFVLADRETAGTGTVRLAAPPRFPYVDDSFDVALMTSIATRLLPQACEHHFAECARVLAPGGTLVASFFCLNDTSRALMASGEAGLIFADADEQVAMLDEALPEEAVAYADEWVFERLREHGLTLTAIHPGSWSGRSEFLGFEDVVVAVRDA